MSHDPNKFRSAIEVLQRGRDQLVEELADEVIDRSDDLLDGGYIFNEFLESQGTRLHFLSLLLSQLEQSAETLDEQRAAEPPPEEPKKRRSRSKKLQQQATTEGSTDDS